MNIFIFPEVNHLTHHYHPEGGLVVVARDKDRAKEMLAEYGDGETHSWSKSSPQITDDEWSKVVVYPTDPGAEEAVYVFPDAGCC